MWLLKVYWYQGNEDFISGLYPATMRELGLNPFSWEENDLYDAYMDGYEGYSF